MWTHALCARVRLRGPAAASPLRRGREVARASRVFKCRWSRWRWLLLYVTHPLLVLVTIYNRRAHRTRDIGLQCCRCTSVVGPLEGDDSETQMLQGIDDCRRRAFDRKHPWGSLHSVSSFAILVWKVTRWRFMARYGADAPMHIFGLVSLIRRLLPITSQLLGWHSPP
ncbi:hypothetical protein EXIGLDRAFT_442519 [Exidia glandulosa HHB12029]|uniref:Uncharacterized protein n=1 Tax=Exidia glandulosa HHB12029 TaxID=1314781 RepID=A0A165KBX1_EXIGL|nr:hypothetical protein EXIGLDRAFT_442519 [Exidia glandulosa HHB12029]